jgi:hypothetical protein
VEIAVFDMRAYALYQFRLVDFKVPTFAADWDAVLRIPAAQRIEVTANETVGEGPSRPA